MWSGTGCSACGADHHKPENDGEGSIRALQCGKLQRLPKLRTSGISMQAGVSSNGDGPWWKKCLWEQTTGLGGQSC